HWYISPSNAFYRPEQRGLTLSLSTVALGHNQFASVKAIVSSAGLPLALRVPLAGFKGVPAGCRSFNGRIATIDKSSVHILKVSADGAAVPCAKENAPGFARGALKKSELLKPSIELLLGRLCSRRRSGWFGCRRLWRCRSGSGRARLHGISLVIESDDVLRDVNLI